MIDMTHGTTNVYTDLDYENADEMLVKAQLVTKISQIINERKWTQQKSADVMGLPRPKLSKILNGQFRGVSEAKLLDCLARLGRNVQIVIGPENAKAEAGHIEVVFAA
ncbi:MAG: helix-turn-helix transcriptional regulator [Advenella sp.]|nr:helix-turn-helix transcriptional regulator [Advenella sp.]